VSTLSNDELLRYSRHIVLKDFGHENQLKLKHAKVLVIGAGGLGCPALLYLTAAGVGTIGVADFDGVQLSNLQRQILFKTSDVGKNKAEAACQRLKELNPLVNFISISEKITANNIGTILKDFSMVIDGSDNFPTRYLVNDACILSGKPLVYGSVLAFEGQVSVFNVNTGTGYGCNYRDLFPIPPAAEQVPNCEQAGVLGVLPGLIGTLQATEAIKLITGIGEVLQDKLLLVDALSFDFTVIEIKNKHTRETVKKLIDYDDFCGVNQNAMISTTLKEITAHELQQLLSSNEHDIQLIDVREAYEYDLCRIDSAEHIPLSQIPHELMRISKTKKVVMHCKSGSRSNQAVRWLEKNHQYTNLYMLKGGIEAWAREIDQTMLDWL
jgi:sulfur-carrier protein adenylyltransferase/sulfurtransferase